MVTTEKAKVIVTKDDKYSNKVIQPDLLMVDTLHKLLDAIPDDNLAKMIDFVVAELIRCDNPPVRHQDAFMPEVFGGD